jgi:peptidoglycan glycosyltransferase
MNSGLRKIFGLIVVLFLLLMASTARWTVFEAHALKNNSKNNRPLLETQKVRRGSIYAADGTLLAVSHKQHDGTYVRHYTAAATLVGQTVGYAFLNAGRSGLEKSHQDDLTGKVRNAASLLNALRGRDKAGNNLVSTLNLSVQKAALAGMNGRLGAAVAIDPRDGAVLAMASNPLFNPNLMNTKAGQAQINATGNHSPALNRATQSGYPPGSTFKVVTTDAALSSGKYTPDTVVSGKSPMVVQTKPLTNFHNEQYGNVTLTQALTYSINTAFARVALDLGADQIGSAMNAFGFMKNPVIDYPDDKMIPSGEYDTTTSPPSLIPVNSSSVDLARMAIGQDKLLVTPLQMALVATTIARGGQLPKLSLMQRIVDPDGRTVDSLSTNGSNVRRVMSTRQAGEMTKMMEKVVDEGTGQAAQLGNLKVAGKTGSAETNTVTGATQPWFIGFAPANDPKIAVAVTLENVINGQGGVDAAPIARAMMEAYLG